MLGYSKATPHAGVVKRTDMRLECGLKMKREPADIIFDEIHLNNVRAYVSDVAEEPLPASCGSFAGRVLVLIPESDPHETRVYRTNVAPSHGSIQAPILTNSGTSRGYQTPRAVFPLAAVTTESPNHASEQR